jgi:hypothetical protein
VLTACDPFSAIRPGLDSRAGPCCVTGNQDGAWNRQ